MGRQHITDRPGENTDFEKQTTVYGHVVPLLVRFPLLTAYWTRCHSMTIFVPSGR
jgi:hypothetical protein